MQEPRTTSSRIVSLDQFRGYTVLGMFFVNFVGGPDYATESDGLTAGMHMEVWW